MIHPQPKPEPRKRAKGRKDRQEAQIKRLVRAACVLRDGYCVLDRGGATDFVRGDVFGAGLGLYDCAGDSQWCHMHARRRSQTRKQAPEIRHDTAYSFMACQRHHDQYDNKQKPRLFVTALTRAGANGPLKFRLGKS